MRVRREQFGKHAVARRDVEHVAGLDQSGQRACQRLPGAARRIMAFHVAGDAVGPAFGARALGEDRRQAPCVVVDQGVVDVFAQRMQQRVGLGSRSELKR